MIIYNMETTDIQQTAISGIVKNYIANKHGDIAAIELALDNETIKISFPPHTAKIMMEKAGQGTFVKAVYKVERPKHDPKGTKNSKLQLLGISGISGGDFVIADLKPQKLDGEPQVKKFSFSEYDLLKGKKGELVGITIGTKLFHIRKEDQAVAGHIKAESTLEITAVKRLDAGFVNQNHDEVFHIQKLIVDHH